MEIKSHILIISAAIVLAGCGSSPAPSRQTAIQLEEGFTAPPQEARPRVWWHWLNANITDEGIKADLEWMNRVGIGGFHNFDANPDTPQIVPERLVYMTEPWKRTYRRMIKMADSLGMEMAIAASPGWSETGGPWVKPEQAMKKLVWSETDVKGGETFKGILPQPPSVPGNFQNCKSWEKQKDSLYRDVAVIAVRLPDADRKLSGLSPKVTTSGGTFTVDELTDGDFAAEKPLLCCYDGSAWIQYEFAEPTVIYSVTEADSYNGIVDFEASDDGSVFTNVVSIPSANEIRVCAASFEPVTGKYFRIYFKPQPGRDKIYFSEFNLSTSPRVNRFIEKAGFCTAETLVSADTPPADKSLCIDGDRTVNLTTKMAADGSLEWTPEGDGTWRILRFGYSLTGKHNSPASPEATGLEVDKLEAGYVREYMNTYLDMYRDATDGMIGEKGIRYIMIDSWEARFQNWTDRMMEYFREYRGYDMLRYLPAMAGYVVDDPVTSDKFLWDFRKTIGQLITEHHYEAIDEVLASRGMSRYTESHACGRTFVGDGIEVKRHADIPMAETWTPTDGNPAHNDMHHEADVRESASVSHIYGQKFVAAESFTAGSWGDPSTAWSWSPETLKPTADFELAAGLNRFVIHSTVHQPDDEHLPGLTLGIFGQWFNRHDTWAEAAGPWITYLSRSSYMLQQGRAVEDILYFYGEDSDITALFHYAQPDMPAGYSYDFVNPDALETVIDVKNGRIVTPAGTEYSLLVLDRNAGRMTLRTLKAIEALVEKGMVVLGDKPSGTPGLGEDETEFEKLASGLWAGSENGARYGRGAVWSGRDIASVLEINGVKPDCQFIGASMDAEMNFVHRTVDGIHIYWIDSRNYGAEDVKVSFKVTGMKPEIWDPVSGRISDISYTADGENTVVPVHFNEYDACFIVFRERTSVKSVEIPSVKTIKTAEVNSAWNVTFNGPGCSKTVVFPALSAWNESQDNEIRYYSGSAVYANRISVPEEDLSKGDVVLNLGDVKNIAEVKVNGQYVGEVWRAPFVVDISDFVRAGDNDIEVKVTNLWINRLIGDMQPGADKYTFTTQPFFKAADPLKPSGLLGPVRLEVRN